MMSVQLDTGGGRGEGGGLHSRARCAPRALSYTGVSLLLLEAPPGEEKLNRSEKLINRQLPLLAALAAARGPIALALRSVYEYY
jgi:hypothetical protein